MKFYLVFFIICIFMKFNILRVVFKAESLRQTFNALVHFSDRCSRGQCARLRPGTGHAVWVCHLYNRHVHKWVVDSYPNPGVFTCYISKCV